jgi:DNA-binding transcriptional regulator YiaG
VEPSKTSIEPIESIYPMTFQIDQMRTKQVADRYGIQYTSLHNRMTKLGIKPTRQGRESYLGASDIELLDKLDEHLKNNGTFDNFAIEQGDAVPFVIEKSNVSGLVKSKRETNTSIQSIQQDGLVEALALIARAQYDVLTPQKTLKEATEEGFLLTSEQVGSILGYSKSTVSSWETGTIKLGFRFHKLKEGSTVLWEVTRVTHDE